MVQGALGASGVGVGRSPLVEGWCRAAQCKMMAAVEQGFQPKKMFFTANFLLTGKLIFFFTMVNVKLTNLNPAFLTEAW